MRKQNTLFAQIVNFINSQPIGSTFTVRELYSKIDERTTSWKRMNNDPNYQTRWYCGRLRVRKVLAKYQRGTWTVLAHIPDFVTSNMIYSSWNTKNPIKWYAGMDTIESMTQASAPIVKQESSEDNELVERLDGMLTIIDETGNWTIPSEVKYVYRFDFDKITKRRVWDTYSLSANERDTLNDALTCLSDLTGKSVHVLGEDMLEKIENELHEKAELEKSKLDKELDKVAEKLNTHLRIVDNSSSLSSDNKFIYKFIGGLLYKVKVDPSYNCGPDEYESLRRLLEVEAGSRLPWTVLAEEIMEVIERNSYYVQKVETTERTIDVKPETVIENKVEMEQPAPKKFITVDDIRGVEVYIERDCKNNWQKAIVQNFGIDCQKNEDPYVYDVEVMWVKDGKYETFDNTYGFCFNKEQVVAKLNDYINSL